MRIGFDAKRAFHNPTGLGNYSRDVIRLFTNRRQQDEFYLFDPKGKGEIHFDFNLFNTHIISSQRRTGIGKSIWRQYGLAREIKELHLDVYHGLSNELPVGIDKTNAKSVVTVHDVIFDRHPEWYPFLDRKIYHQKLKRSLIEAHTIVAISEQTKNDIAELYGVDEHKIKVIYQGCNPVFLKKQQEEEIAEHLNTFNIPEDFILYVGTIEPRKNLHRLVEALSDNDIPLVVVGRPTEYLKKVQESIQNSGLLNRFYYLPQVNLNQLAALYQKARLFVYPSLYEGFGIPVIEALHCETPVITGFGALQEAAGPGGICVDVGNVAAIREAISDCWNNESLLARLSEAGRHHVQRFTDEPIWRDWQNLYQEMA